MFRCLDDDDDAWMHDADDETFSPMPLSSIGMAAAREEWRTSRWRERDSMTESLNKVTTAVLCYKMILKTSVISISPQFLVSFPPDLRRECHCSLVAEIITP